MDLRQELSCCEEVLGDSLGVVKQLNQMEKPFWWCMTVICPAFGESSIGK
jgi:hypothetical protein